VEKIRGHASQDDRHDGGACMGKVRSLAPSNGFLLLLVFFLTVRVSATGAENQSCVARDVRFLCPEVHALRSVRFSEEANRMRRSCVLLFLLGLAVPVFGQSNYAVLTGTVSDSQRLPVAGAAVELTAASTGAIRRVVTNQQGLSRPQPSCPMITN